MTACPERKFFRGPTEPLSNPEDHRLHQQLYEDVTILSHHIGPRNFYHHPLNLLKAKNYILEQLKLREEWDVKEQEVEATPEELGKCLEDNGFIFNGNEGTPVYTYKGNRYSFNACYDKHQFTNIIAEKKGDGGEQNRITTIIAHYDTVDDSPGADDNASGVAASLALIQMFSSKGESRRDDLRFVFVPNEEWPLSRTKYMGSLYYFRSLPREEKSRMDVIAFDALGYYREDLNSQNLKLPILSGQYPNKIGNFIALMGKSKNKDSLEPEPLLVKAFRAFSEANLIRSEWLNAPIEVYGFDNKGCENDIKTLLWGDIVGLVLREAGHSDHWSAWTEGVDSAIMITDTAMARNPNYHKKSDTYETLNYTYLVRVVQSLHHVISSL